MPAILINGRGQLGEELKKRISHPLYSYKSQEVLIYHTWNIDDKTEPAQEREYLKFVEFVKENREKRIVFISTYSDKDNYYNFYKHKAESYVILNSVDALVVRLPTIVGKGVITDFINDTNVPYGTMNLITKSRAATEVLNHAFKKTLTKSVTVAGESVSAFLIKGIIDEIKK